MAKAKSRSKHWEREAKVGAEKIKRAKKEREEAKKEAKVARLAATTLGDAKARVEDELARVLDALAAAEEDEHKLVAEIAHLAVERTSLLLELEASKMRCTPFIHRWARTTKPWRKTTKKPWS